ncbi:MAG: ferritin-like domain-containing protein [Oceanospirillaceae bacterium]|nr:ferritin-like domain-containing protein [Oceanospirillaceae bacterium]
MQRVQHYWYNQAIAEYTSAARTVELSHWMQRLAFSPDLIRDAIRISDDEMVHAQMCFDLAKLAGSEKNLPLNNMQLILPQEYPLLGKSLLIVLVQSYCFGETAAVPLFAAMRKSASKDSVLAAYDRILQDEPRHAKFGWVALAWCCENWPQAREWLVEITPIALGRMRKAYCDHPAFDPQLSQNEIDWGVFPRELYGEILERTIATTYSQRLAYYDIPLL